MDFYRRSNTHDPDQDGFEDLYRHDFIHAISHVARRKLAHHHLDPYQRATFCRGIVRYNMGKEEADPTLELAMEYTGALGTIIFDESCHLQDLTEAQVGRNQFAVDVVVDRLDGEADHAAERIRALEDKEADMERSLNALLELGREQTEALSGSNPLQLQSGPTCPRGRSARREGNDYKPSKLSKQSEKLK